MGDTTKKFKAKVFERDSFSNKSYISRTNTINRFPCRQKHNYALSCPCFQNLTKITRILEKNIKLILSHTVVFIMCDYICRSD